MSRPYLLTHSGARIDLLDPDPAAVTLPDIAHALARICRYTGHCSSFYSVAQHSVLVAEHLRNEGATLGEQRQGLMHDAHEAYTGDVASPIKRALREIANHAALDGGAVAGSLLCHAFDAFESRHARAVRRRFGLPAELAKSVHAADLALLMAEKRYLMPIDPLSGGGWPNVRASEIYVWPRVAVTAETEFLAAAERLGVV